MIYLTQEQVYEAAKRIAFQISDLPSVREGREIKLYGVPRGGVPAAYLVMGIGNHQTHGMFSLVEKPEEATAFIDDLIDSGATQIKFCQKPFYALFDKRQHPQWKNEWLVFPWEQSAESSLEENIVRLLQFFGEDIKRDGLKDTPARVAKAWQFWCSGYKKDPKDILKVFEDGAKNYNEMVVVKDIPFYSHCEHHLAPIFGTVTVGYVPNGKIVGLSKIPRLVEVFARRLQVQERLTVEIAEALEEHLKPQGVAVVIRARHLCMESRGICQQGHTTVTSALKGVLNKPEARAEFLNL